MPSVIRGSDNFDTAGGNAVKAWVDFNGQGTVAIRASYNVSSITDNGVGDYTVNFSTALADANYAASFMCQWTTSGGPQSSASIAPLAGVKNASNLRIYTFRTDTAANNDFLVNTVAIFR